MDNQDKQIEEIKEIRKNFRTKFDVLRIAKDSFLKLFRLKLEEKKIEEIKNKLR